MSKSYSFQITNNTLFKHILKCINNVDDEIDSQKDGEIFYIKNLKKCAISDGKQLNLLNCKFDIKQLGLKISPYDKI